MNTIASIAMTRFPLFENAGIFTAGLPPLGPIAHRGPLFSGPRTVFSVRTCATVLPPHTDSTSGRVPMTPLFRWFGSL